MKTSKELRPFLDYLPSPGDNPFRLFTYDELIELGPVEWIVEDAIPKEGFVVLYGPSGAGKTFVALDLALSIAQGRDWLGMPTQAGTVVYGQSENPRGMRARMAAWAEHYTASLSGNRHFFLITEPVQLADRESVRRFLEAISAVEPSLVVIDTLSKSFVGGDENGAQDMTQLVDGARRIINQTGATVLLVHHTGKDVANGERGSSVLRGALDTSMELRKKGDDHVVLKFAKQRDTEGGHSLMMRKVEVGESLVTTIDPSVTKYADGLSREHLRALFALSLSGAEGMKVQTWGASLNLTENVLDDRMRHIRGKLQALELIESPKHGWWRVTEAGREFIETSEIDLDEEEPILSGTLIN